MGVLDSRRLDRVLLGTVQLGLAYGRHAGGKAPDREQSFLLLDFAWEIGIRAFDTAEAYGESAPRLSDWMRLRSIEGECRVVTKILAADVPDPSAVDRALDRFSDVPDRTILTHGAASTDHFQRFRDSAVRRGACAGASVYESHEVRAMAAAGARRIQAPVNVFDDRQAFAAREMCVPLDARSVFLQGVLLESPECAEARAPGTGRLALIVQQAAGEVDAPLSALLLATTMDGLGPTDRVVIGVDTIPELRTVHAALSISPTKVSQFRDRLAALKSRWKPEARVLDPRQWNAR